MTLSHLSQPLDAETKRPISTAAATTKPSTKDCACTKIMKPVCGKDGTTYSNACMATCAGVEVGAEGKCKEVAFTYSPQTSFAFSSKGNSVDVPGDTNRECNAVSSFKEDAPGIAMAVDKRQGHCWYGGNYNHRDFSIQPGLVGPFRAYKISAPKSKAKKFAASENTIWVSFDKAGSYKVYVLGESGDLHERGNVTTSKAGELAKTTVVADADAGVILVVAPASVKLSM